ncbi:MAG: preprotein translocase subunit YajC [Defluviitaleaceae bacterium]|nr:preprotein translocase subunit YajC [Defluviitaleaceae bacterium]
MTQIFSALWERTTFLGIPGMPPPDGATGVGGGEVAQAVNDTAATVGDAAANGGGEPASIIPMILMFGGMFVVMYFLMIRPQRKREQKMRELQAAIGVNDEIVTSGGLFGKIISVGEDCFLVEFGINRGVHIPVLKADVVSVRTPVLTPPPKETEGSVRD